jgi:hypothetical protein
MWPMPAYYGPARGGAGLHGGLRCQWPSSRVSAACSARRWESHMLSSVMA